MNRVGISVLFCVAAYTSFGQERSDEIRMSIQFGGGSYYISGEKAMELHEWLDTFPNLLEKYEIHLISHTDPIGGREYNEQLSRMRSAAVKNLLVQWEIPENRISIKDWGLENPVYSNDSYQGMINNRRVDVILYPILF